MTLPPSIQKNFAKFQAPTDVPVFLKGGPLDKGLFGLTVALCGLGLLGFVNLVYTMGFKKKSA